MRLMQLITAVSALDRPHAAWPLNGLRELACGDPVLARWLSARGFPTAASASDCSLQGHASSENSLSGNGLVASHATDLYADAAEAKDKLWNRLLAELASLAQIDLAAASQLGSTDAHESVVLAQRSMRLVGLLAAETLRREKQIDESDRLALARGIAYDMAYGLSHELNNPLANIATRARLLAESESDAHKRGLLEAIVDQAMRGCEMIADLMTVARPPLLVVEDFDLVPLLRNLHQRATVWAGARGLVIECQVPTQPIKLKGDPQAVGEALWAMLRNAIETAAGAIELQCAVIDQVAGAHPLVSHAGKWLRVSILDDGPGLSEEASQRAFHPYFSGREAGRGLGLGLSKAERIAEQFGGYAMLQSRQGGGCEACWFVPLPLHD